MESQRQWSDLAIARTTPILLGLYSWVTLAADSLVADGVVSIRQAAWYSKPLPTFSDALAWVRYELWSTQFDCSLSPSTHDTLDEHHFGEHLLDEHHLIKRLLDTVCYAT